MRWKCVYYVHLYICLSGIKAIFFNSRWVSIVWKSSLHRGAFFAKRRFGQSDRTQGAISITSKAYNKDRSGIHSSWSGIQSERPICSSSLCTIHGTIDTVTEERSAPYWRRILSDERREWCSPQIQRIHRGKRWRKKSIVLPPLVNFSRH